MELDNTLIQEFFLKQREFIDSDPYTNYALSHGLVLKNHTNTFIRLSHWITPEELKNKKVLDIGCRVAVAGAYSLYYGAKKYVGVDNDRTSINAGIANLEKYYSDRDFEMIYEDAEKFVQNLTEDFDVVFLGRVLHYINNLESFMTTLSKKITGMIVIEDAHPPLFFMDYLLENSVLSNEEKKFILKKIEYDYPLSEHHYFEKIFQNFKNFPHNTIVSTKDEFIGSGYSIGYLKLLLHKENFVEELSMYESIQQYFPNEYGYGIYENRDGCKKYIVRFCKAAT